MYTFLSYFFKKKIEPEPNPKPEKFVSIHNFNDDRKEVIYKYFPPIN